MALERIGLGGVLTFDPTGALAGMGRARSAFASLRAGAMKLRSGLRSVGMGMMQLSIVGAGVGLVLGSMIKTAAAFQKQMSGVEAIVQGTTEQMAALTSQAKQLGATTAFTAIQAAEAQELLSRAGFSVNEVLSATPAILSAAAAEGMELATAAGIVAGTLRGMGLDISEASHVADVLALASAKAKTTMIGLGEGFKFASPKAKSLGFTLEETAAALAKIADANIEGTLSGTAFNNMLVKLGRPSSKATKLMKQWGIAMTDADGKIKPLSDIVGQFKVQIDAIPDAMQRAATITELFGVRGEKAFSALATAGPEALADLTTMLEHSSKGVGAAARMAETRLDNVAGAVTILKSAWEGLKIEIGDFILQNASVRDGIKQVTRFVSDLVLTLQGQKETVREVNGELYKYNPAMTMAGKVAKGLRAGLETVTDSFKNAAMWIRDTGERLGITFGGDMVSKIVQIATVLLSVLAAIAPIGMAAFVLGFAFSGIASIVSGLGTIIGALFGPIGIIIGAVIVGFMLIRKEGESIGETIKRLIGIAQRWFEVIKEEASKAALIIAKFFGPSIKSMIVSFENIAMTLAKSIIPNLRGLWNLLKPIAAIALAPILIPFIISWKIIMPILAWVAEKLAVVVGWIIEGAAWLGNALVPAWEWVNEKVQSFIAWIGQAWEFVKGVGALIVQMVTNIGKVWGRVWTWVAAYAKSIWASIMDKVIMPVWNWIKGIAKKIGDVFVKAWNWIANTAKKTWAWIMDKAITPAWNWIKGIAAKVRDAFVGAFTKIRDVATSIFRKITMVLAAPFQKVMSFVSSIIAQVAGTALGKAALAAVGVTVGEVRKFQTEIGKLAAVTFAPKPREAAKIVEEGVTTATEKAPATKAMKEKAAAAGETVGAQQPCIDVKNDVKVGIDSKLSVDGSEMAVASASHQAEVSERAGFSTTPWQKRKILEVGAIPATGGVPA